MKQTTLTRHQVDNFSKKTKEFTEKIREARKDQLLRLSDGILLEDFLEQYNVSRTNGYKIFNNFGEVTLREYCKTYKKKITSLEIRFIDLLKSSISTNLYNKKPLEVDYNCRPDFRVQLENKLLYINVDGLYDHMEGGRRNPPKNYHFNLREQFNKNNINIFQFRSDEIIKKSEIVKSIILHYFNIDQQRIFARKCEIKEVDSKKSNEFLIKNHLMGSSKSKAYGLYYEQELVCLMTIKKVENGIDISRFCCKMNVSVIGGLSRLFSYVIKKHQPEFIQSFVDLRYATGSSYIKLGFELKNTTLGWRWTDRLNTFNRLQCKANKKQKLTEKQHAIIKKWNKIYDAGQAKYVKILKKSSQ